MDSLDNAILRQETFGQVNEKNKATALHIAFGVDAAFMRPMGVAMTSLIDNNQNLIFHVFANSINQIDLERLRELAVSTNTLINLYYINNAIFKTLQTTWNYTAATYNRFIVAKYLAAITERVLYMDADMICKGSLAELQKMDFAGNIAMVVHDQGKFVADHLKTLHLQHGKYFNAGMLYIDLPAWNDQQISEQAIELLKTRKFFLLDQDALNILLDGKAKFIERKWNEICNMEKTYSKISYKAIIVHFASRNKPWQIWCRHQEKALFFKYADKSLWKDVPLLDQPRNYKEMKMLGAAMLHDGKYKTALLWYWRYWQAKRQEKK